MNIKVVKNGILVSVIFVSVFTVATSMSYKTGLPIANTTLMWVINFLTLIFFFLGKLFIYDKHYRKLPLVNFYLLWMILCIIRGFFIADGYWDWKTLTDHSMSLLIPLVVFAVSNTELMRSILICYVKYALPLFLVLYFLVFPDGYGYYLMPMAFISLFFPVLNFRCKLLLLFICFLVIFSDLNARSNVIKFAVPLLFSFIYYARFFLNRKFIEFLRNIFFLIPPMLLFLAVTNTFNVFKMDEYIDIDMTVNEINVDGSIEDANLKADTRTLLYVEVFETLNGNNDWLIGRSPARGYESILFGDADENSRGERAGCEVSLLNILTWTGVVGVTLYSLLFYSASYLAVNQSNSIFSKIIGLFVAFRWLFSWIEDFNVFNIGYLFLWFMIGLCFSKSFREMSDLEITLWIRSVFDRKINKRIV